MDRPRDNANDSAEPRVPEKLAAELRERYELPHPVPSEVDDAVLALTRQQLARRRLIPLAIRWIAAGAAAAAVVLVLASLSWRGMQFSPRPEPAGAAPAAAAAEDVDGNGRVDILDAFALARHVEAGEQVRSQWDVTGDGAVNREDVDRIALAAVDLRRGAF
jgi:hypothetical protein